MRILIIIFSGIIGGLLGGILMYWIENERKNR